MKLQGHTFDKPNTEICAIPRGNGPDIVFIAEAIIDNSDFENLCPPPKPPLLHKPGGVKETNFKDPTYLQAVVQQSELRHAWWVITSLKATPGLEWETVDFGNPKTWLNYKTELRAAKFSEIEIQRIEAAVYNANCLNEGRIQEARENFLRGQAEEKEQSSGPLIEPNSIQSGEPVAG